MSDYEDGRVLMDVESGLRWLPVTEIERVKFLSDRGSAAMENAILSGIGGAATGALTGAFAAWQAGADVKRTSIFAATVFGVAGFVTGLFRGAASTRGTAEFVLGPVPSKEKNQPKGDEAAFRP